MFALNRKSTLELNIGRRIPLCPRHRDPGARPQARSIEERPISQLSQEWLGLRRGATHAFDTFDPPARLDEQLLNQTAIEPAKPSDAERFGPGSIQAAGEKVPNQRKIADVRHGGDQSRVRSRDLFCQRERPHRVHLSLEDSGKDKSIEFFAGKGKSLQRAHRIAAEFLDDARPTGRPRQKIEQSGFARVA